MPGGGSQQGGKQAPDVGSSSTTGGPDTSPHNPVSVGKQLPVAGAAAPAAATAEPSQQATVPAVAPSAPGTAGAVGAAGGAAGVIRAAAGPLVAFSVTCFVALALALGI